MGSIAIHSCALGRALAAGRTRLSRSDPEILTTEPVGLSSERLALTNNKAPGLSAPFGHWRHTAPPGTKETPMTHSAVNAPRPTDISAPDFLEGFIPEEEYAARRGVSLRTCQSGIANCASRPPM